MIQFLSCMPGCLAIGSVIMAEAKIFGAIPRGTLREAALDRLRNAIVFCDLLPGTRLVERELSQSLAVSRTPVREALMALEREGLVTTNSRGWMVVAPCSEQEIEEIYPLIANLERFAITLTAPLDTGTQAALEAIMEAYELEIGNPRRMVELDNRWHWTLLKNCSNRRVLEILNRLKRQALRYEFAFFNSGNRSAFSLEEHCAVVDEMKSGNLQAAGRLLEAHWLGSMPSLKAAILEVGLMTRETP